MGEALHCGRDATKHRRRDSTMVIRTRHKAKTMSGKHSNADGRSAATSLGAGKQWRALWPHGTWDGQPLVTSRTGLNKRTNRLGFACYVEFQAPSCIHRRTTTWERIANLPQSQAELGDEAALITSGYSRASQDPEKIQQDGEAESNRKRGGAACAKAENSREAEAG